MHESHLITYLNDHLAGAVTAIEVIERLIAENEGRDLAEFASDLLAEIQSDRAQLQQLLGAFDGLPGTIKQAVAWAGAKLTGPKLGSSIAGQFGTFQALELLSLGILGKRALWRVLADIQSADRRLAELDYVDLITRAEHQYSQVEQWRRRLGQAALLQPE